MPSIIRISGEVDLKEAASQGRRMNKWVDVTRSCVTKLVG